MSLAGLLDVVADDAALGRLRALATGWTAAAGSAARSR